VLELGCYEGRSSVWWLTHLKPKAMICVDLFDTEGNEKDTWGDMSHVKRRFLANCGTWISEGVLQCVQGRTDETMIRLIQEGVDRFDFIYIDASHLGRDVMRDAVLADLLLTEGGVLLFDDYLGGHEEEARGRYKDPVANPKFAIDSFLAVNQERYEILHQGYQMAALKRG